MAAHLHRPVYAAAAAAVLTMAMKAAAYLATGSVGLFSDAAESLINLVASLTALASLWYAARPADADHTYGHEKIVYFSSGLEALLIVIAAAGTAAYAVRRIIWPVELQRLELGTLIALAASVVNLGVARWLLHVGRRHDSVVLEASGQHLMTDVWTSVAVVAGIALVAVTGIDVLDPIAALLMCAAILVTGGRLMLRSFNGLMDRALPEAEQAAVREAIESRLTDQCAYHALRTRQAGSRKFVEFHLLLPGSTTVRLAHAHADRIEDAVRAALPEAQITVHIEPIEEPESYKDSELIGIEPAG